jgi:hypothetical protein
MKCVRAERGVGTALGDHDSDPLGRVSTDQPDPRRPLLTQKLEELLEGLLVTSDRGPDESSAVVVHHHGQVLVPAPVADLVDADADESLEGVLCRTRVTNDPGDDRAHGAPRDPHHFGDRGLRGVGHEPGHLVVEVPSVASTVGGPGHLSHCHPVFGAVDPWGVGLQIAERHAKIERSPVPSSPTLVIAGSPTSTETTSTLRRPPRTHVDHDRVSLFIELHRLNHGRPIDTERPTPYACVEHANLLGPVS